VFMGADTLEGTAPLRDAAKDDLDEMASIGSGNALNIFVQIHDGKGVPQRRHVGVSPSADVPAAQRETARGRALASFIQWALSKAGHDPSNPLHHSILVLWGHAYDFAIGHSQTKMGTIDALDFAELSGVLERLQERFDAPKAKLDILGFDACDLATVEMACELQPFASYLLGSQIGIPIPGWPYDRILDRLRNPIGRLMSPAEFGSYIVRRYCESYTASSRTVSLTLLDLNRAPELFARTEVLALTLASAIGNADARNVIARLFSQSQTAERKPYVDVANLCLNLARDSGNAQIAAAARSLGDFLISPQPSIVGCSAEGGGRPFIVEHGRNAGETARLNGISLYAPHVAPNDDFTAVRHLYQNFVFAQETRWSDLVHTLARLS
jgi:cysteine peptidase C11 family protein